MKRLSHAIERMLLVAAIGLVIGCASERRSADVDEPSQSGQNGAVAQPQSSSRRVISSDDKRNESTIPHASTPPRSEQLGEVRDDLDGSLVRSGALRQLPTEDAEDALALKPGFVTEGKFQHRGGRNSEVATSVDGVPVRNPSVKGGATLDENTEGVESSFRPNRTGEGVKIQGKGADDVSSQESVKGRFNLAMPRATTSRNPSKETLEQLKALGHTNSAHGNRFTPPPSPTSAADILARHSGEELWIIEADVRSTQQPNDMPRCGSMLATVGDRSEVPVPLEHTEVEATVSAFVSTVSVTQTFHNPFDEKIEAVYYFPLPHDAAVHEFVMTIGDRRIRGIVRERDEARQIYEAAKRLGHVASLLSQERPNIFEQAVANIEPGKRIDVDIEYFHALSYVDGSYEFVFPMVVGPRFNPPGTTDGIGAVAHGSHGASNQNDEVQYLEPGERSGHDIALSLSIDAGVSIEDLESPTHLIDVERPERERAIVTLSRNDRIPNKDFVLRYRVAGDELKTAIMTHEDERGGYFALMMYPPSDLEALRRQPVEMVFVLDTSGSMNGWPITQARSAARRCLQRLEPNDTFQIIRFSDSASRLGTTPIRATPDNVRRGLSYLEGLHSGGGTHMLSGIHAALDFPSDPGRMRFISFMTDGYIGNENDIFAAIDAHRGNARVFSFGVGSSVNRHLLEGMARIGRGAVAYVTTDETSLAAVDGFYERVRYPALTDIQIDWRGLEVSHVYPEQVPDLFPGRAVVMTGRFTGDVGDADIHIQGRVGDESRRYRLDLPGDSGTTHGGIASVWARTRITTLADRSAVDHHPGADLEIRDLALEYGLASSFTSFVAVDTRSDTGLDQATTVPVGVPMPQGVDYETTVSGHQQRH